MPRDSAGHFENKVTGGSSVRYAPDRQQATTVPASWPTDEIRQSRRFAGAEVSVSALWRVNRL